jgi:hypothetical protein
MDDMVPSYCWYHERYCTGEVSTCGQGRSLDHFCIYIHTHTHTTYTHLIQALSWADGDPTVFVNWLPKK